MRSRHFIPGYIWLICACLLLAACTPGVTSDPATLTPTPHITGTPTQTGTPFQFSTATRTNTPTPRPSPTPLPTDTPTITPSRTDVGAVNTGQVVVPILLYHRISDEGKTRYFVSPANFRTQMKALADGGYQTVSISQVADAIRGKGSLPPKPVVLTFDDGYEDTYQNALPILHEFGFTGVAYIITDTLGTKLSYGYMQADELKALVAAGWEIGSHSVTHSDVMTSKLGMGTELRKSKADLEALLGVPVRSFSYPYGSANPWVREHVKDYGYDSAVGLDTLVTQSTRRLYYLSRREVYHSLTLADFKALLTPNQDELIRLKLETETP